MFIDTRTLDENHVIDKTVCVIGAGPAGLACAFDLHDRGQRVLLLEAGGENPVPGEPDVRAADHADVEIASKRGRGRERHGGGPCFAKTRRARTHALSTPHNAINPHSYPNG